MLIYNLFTRDVYYAREFDEIYVWGGSVTLDRYMLAILQHPTLKGRIKGVFKEYNVDQFGELVREIEKSVEQGSTARRCFLFDDVGGQQVKGRGGVGAFNECVLNLRHKEISMVFSMQRLSMGGDTFLDMSEGLAALGKSNKDEQFLMYRKFGDSTAEDFYKMYRHATNEPYSFLFVNNQGPQTIYRKRFHTKLLWSDDCEDECEEQPQQQTKIPQQQQQQPALECSEDELLSEKEEFEESE